MVSFDSSLGTPPLVEAIDRYPLIVTPQTCLLNVVTLMHDTAKKSHLPRQTSTSSPEDSLCGARSSCVLVMQDDILVGIFTERDLVQLTATGADLRSTLICEVMHHPVLTMTEQSLHNVFAALFLFRRHRIRHLAITNDQQQLLGVISLDSIRHILRPTNLLKIRRVAEVMTKQVITASPDTPVIQLVELMATQQISCIVIVVATDEDSVYQPVGIVTERDVVRFQALGLDINTTSAQAVMSTPLFVLSPEDSLWTAHQEMERRQVRRLVVSWDWGQKLAIVTQTSILRVFDPIEMHDVIETLQRTIQQLGLDLEQVLANNPDIHLYPSAQAANLLEKPNLKQLLDTLQTQIQQLHDQPELSTEIRQRTLNSILTDLQHVQNCL